MIIGKDEMDDFYESINRNRFDRDDFKINDDDISKPNQDGTYDQKIKIMVTRKSNGKQKNYQGGHLTKWNSDFDDDLRSGFFGSP